ncbi:MAG: hypothetical protein H6651_01040 [Ardenticatenales bacterium]|nr:hypothetical protein [Ardenticatenales bacterium]
MSIQVYLGSEDREKYRTQVLTLLRRWSEEQGLVEYPSESVADADRTFYVGFLGDSPWLTVIDSQGGHNKISQYLSDGLKGTVVSAALYDSDAVILERFTNGLSVDQYCSVPALLSIAELEMNPFDLTDVPVKAEEELRGDLGKWADLFRQGTDMEKMRQIWDSKPIFADDIFWATTDALGMVDQELAFDFWEDSDQYTSMHFRVQAEKQYEKKATGVPRLNIHAASEQRDLFEGQAIEIYVNCQNVGGDAKGLDVLVWGTAISSGQVRPTAIKADVRASGRLADDQSLELVTGFLNGQELEHYKQTFAQLVLPAGIADPTAAIQQPGINLIKAHAALYDANIQFIFKLDVLRAGESELQIAFVPHGDMWEGFAVHSLNLSIEPPPRLPLRSLQARMPPLIYARDMMRTTHLFGLYSLTVVQNTATQLAVEILAQLLTRIAPSETVTLSITNSVRHQPEHRKLRVEHIIDEGHRHEIQEASKDACHIRCDWSKGSLLFDARPLKPHPEPRETAAHILIIQDTTLLSDEELAVLTNWLPELADRLMLDQTLLQAVAGSWHWPNPYYLDYTPYEVACSLNGQCTMTRRWCRQFLRAVTSQIWLGPSLVAQLDSLIELSQIADLLDLNKGLRIALRADATLNDLERLLDPILPSEQDWQRHMRRWFVG